MIKEEDPDNEAAPMVGDEGGAGEVDGLRQEAQEDLEEDVVRENLQRWRGWAVAGEPVHGILELGDVI
jgi:hypothetical protein